MPVLILTATTIVMEHPLGARQCSVSLIFMSYIFLRTVLLRGYYCSHLTDEKQTEKWKYHVLLTKAAGFCTVAFNKTHWEFQIFQALCKVLQLQTAPLPSKSPQSRSQESHVKSLVVLTSSCRKTHCCKGKVCRDIPWLLKLVWAGSVLQYNVAFLNLASTEGPPISGLHSNAPLWAHTPSLTITLLLFIFLLSNTYFSFFTIFSPFFSVNYRRQVQPEARSSVCRGSRLE